MALEKVIIIGGGISGVAAALALQQQQRHVSIYELRDGPSTIGGALNLTPNALRYLDAWNVLPKLLPRGCSVGSFELYNMIDGTMTAEMPLGNVARFGYQVMRILRKDLLDALLETLGEQGVSVEYGKAVSEIQEIEGGIRAVFKDGTSVDGQLLLGCDGIHSRTRMGLVEPERRPIYTKIAVVLGLVDAASLTSPIHFRDTAFNMSPNGSLIASYFNPDRRQIFLGALMQTEEEKDRDGWRVRGSDQDRLGEELKTRFKDIRIPCLSEMIANVNELSLYPVHKLTGGGRWSRGGVVMLLGDAAHAMPPQGESVGYALEDVALFAELLKGCESPAQLPQLFQRYEDLRRPRIDAALKETEFRWAQSTHDTGWLKFKMQQWAMPWFLWFTRDKKEEDFSSDVRKLIE
ncbi:MAG: hypothetical protein LQ352_002007 [Teloschistes flavicans]|nr:MAG: hypothetical protein LQ352_002007 [Teloschistes flavicans]